MPPLTDLTGAGFGHVKVLPFTFEKSAYLEADPEYAGCPTFKFSGWASLAVPDADGEVIHPGFFDARLAEFMANPVMRWMHGRGDVQGSWTGVQAVPGQGYQAQGVAIDYGREEDRARLNMLRTGSVRSLSVGFDAYLTPEFGYYDDTTKLWNWTKNGRLLEISPCDIPACPGASIQLAKSLGLGRASLVVPDIAVAEPEAAKSDAPPSVSFAANIAAEVAEEAAEEQLWEIMDGIWCTLYETIEAILAVTGDRTALIAQLGADLSAELAHRLADVGDEQAATPMPMGAMLARAVDELSRRKAATLDLPTDAEWPIVAITAAKLFGAAGGLGIPETARQAAVDLLTARYEQFGKALPTYPGEWPASLKDVTFHEDELDLLEEQQGEDAMHRLSGAAQRLGDMSVHFTREGLTPSPAVLGTLAEAAQTAAEGACRVGKAGAVLSAANLALVDAAIAALNDLRASAMQTASQVEPAKGHEPGCPCCAGARTVRLARSAPPVPERKASPTLNIRR